MNQVVHRIPEASQSRRASLGGFGVGAKMTAVSLKEASMGVHEPEHVLLPPVMRSIQFSMPASASLEWESTERQFSDVSGWISCAAMAEEVAWMGLEAALGMYDFACSNHEENFS